MRILRLSLLGLAALASISLSSAVTVTFSTGASFTLFQTTDGGALETGYLHAGYYATSPVGLNSQELRDSFQFLATLPDDSGASGYFGANGTFPETAVGGAASQSLYLAVTDTPDVTRATQIAVLTNSDKGTWTYPAADPGFNPSPSLEDIVKSAAGSSILAGSETTSSITSGGPAIQLTAVIPEPSTSLLALLGIAGLLRRRR